MLTVAASAPMRSWHLDPLHPVKGELVGILGTVTIKLLIAAVALALMYFEINPALDALVGWNREVTPSEVEKRRI